MILQSEQIEKAQRRAAGLDLRGLIAELDRVTGVLRASASEKADRQKMLTASKGDPELADAALERIVDGNELQDVNYFPRGARAADAVGRVVIRRSNGSQVGYGTGFMIGPGVMMTNNHVLPDATMAERSELEMEFERDVEGRSKPSVLFGFLPKTLFYTSEALDFSIVAVVPQTDSGSRLFNIPAAGSNRSACARIA